MISDILFLVHIVSMLLCLCRTVYVLFIRKVEHPILMQIGVAVAPQLYNWLVLVRFIVPFVPVVNTLVILWIICSTIKGWFNPKIAE